MILGKKMATAMTKALHSDGFNLVQNNGEAAGQTVFHFHMHLIPRYQSAKNNDILMWSHENFSDEEMAQIQRFSEPELEAEHGFGLETIIQRNCHNKHRPLWGDK